MVRSRFFFTSKMSKSLSKIHIRNAYTKEINLYPLPHLSRQQKTTKIVFYNFFYMISNLTLLGSRCSEYILLIASEARQPKGSLLAELRQGQHFCVANVDGGGSMRWKDTKLIFLVCLQQKLFQM